LLTKCREQLRQDDGVFLFFTQDGGDLNALKDNEADADRAIEASQIAREGE